MDCTLVVQNSPKKYLVELEDNVDLSDGTPFSNRHLDIPETRDGGTRLYNRGQVTFESEAGGSRILSLSSKTQSNSTNFGYPFSRALYLWQGREKAKKKQ